MLGQGTGYTAQRGGRYPARPQNHPSYAPPTYGGYDPRQNQGLSDWYRSHPAEGQSQLMQCGQNPGVAQDPQCMEAIRADRQGASFQRVQAQFGDIGYGAPVVLDLIATPGIK